MSATIHVVSGRVEGGQTAERLTLRLLWLFSWLLVPIRFRGLWRVCRILCRITGVTDRQWLILPSGLRFSVDLRDPYWDRLISPRHHYEPELDWLLEKLKNTDYCFIDGGANFGYWSCNAASDRYGRKPVYAIEPLEENFELLQQHLQANGLSAQCYHRAICESQGERISLYKPGGNASVSIFKPERKPKSHHAWVETLNLDHLLADLPPAPTPLVLKLDVEEAEVSALKGAAEFLKRQPLIVYEDHGKDRTDRVTDYLLNVLHYRIFYVSDDGDVQPVPDRQTVRTIKTRRDKGYNFFAFSPSAHCWAAIFS